MIGPKLQARHYAVLTMAVVGAAVATHLTAQSNFSASESNAAIASATREVASSTAAVAQSNAQIAAAIRELASAVRTHGQRGTVIAPASSPSSSEGESMEITPNNAGADRSQGVFELNK